MNSINFCILFLGYLIFIITVSEFLYRLMGNFLLQDQTMAKPADDQSNGIFNGRRLFSCRPGHGDFVEVEALIKASDLRGSATSGSESPTITSYDTTGKYSNIFILFQRYLMSYSLELPLI